MTTPANAILVVDETLKRLAEAGLSDAGITPGPDVTIGPLDRDDDGPRLNWFLYGIGPHPSFRNMEHPRTGSMTRRGAPPLALELRYLLAAYGAPPTQAGEEDQLIHVALAAVMRRLMETPIVGTGSPFLPSTPTFGLVEPLRLTLEPFDLEATTKIWTAATRALRLSVTYRVSLVVVEQQQVAPRPGPPVVTPRVVVLPSHGPRLGPPKPDRIGGDLTTTVSVTGPLEAGRFWLATAPGDPSGAPTDGWPMVVVAEQAGRISLRVPRHDLVAGPRQLGLSASVEGVSCSADPVGLTLVPIVTVPPGPMPVGQPVTLTTAHTGPDTEVFCDGVPATTGTVTPTTVAITVPGPPGPRQLMLRSAQVAGPPVLVEVSP